MKKIQSLSQQGIPPSCSFTEKCSNDEAALAEFFLVNTHMQQVRSAESHASSEPAEDESEWTPKMLKFKAAIDAGEFKMKTPLGQDFQRAKAQDADLRRRYDKVGSNRDAQEAFRLKWARTELQNMKTVIMEQTDKHNSYENVDGHYRTFGRIVVEQGNDEAAYVGALNVVQACMEDFAAGRTFRGKPYIKYDVRSKRVRYLDIDESVGVGVSREYKLTNRQEQDEGDGAALGDPAPSGHPSKGCKRQLGAPTPTKPKAQKASADGTSEGQGKADDAEKSQRKTITKTLQAVEKTKKDAMIAMQICADLIQSIATNPEWSWANSPQNLKKLREQRQEVEQFKDTSDFWKQAFMQEKFAQYAKKNFEDNVIASEGARASELDSRVTALHAESDRIKRMHAAYTQ